jgi:hypothetical protein
MDGREEPWLDGCNKLPNHSMGEWMLVCMRLIAVRKELSTSENPWSF